MKETIIRAENFPGFYQGMFDEEHVVKNEYDSLEYEYPSFEHIREWELDSDLFQKTVVEYFAQCYIGEIESTLHLGIDYDEEDVEPWSPKEYNHATDRIYIKIKIADEDEFITKLTTLMERHREQLAEIIKKNHTSCDGFRSYMDNDIKDWFEYIKEIDGENLYISYTLYYLYKVISKHSDESMCDCVLMDVQDSGGVHVRPVTDKAMAEYEAYHHQLAEWERQRNLPTIPGLIDMIDEMNGYVF